MKIATFVFNPFGVNTYLLIAENNNTIIVDAACSNSSERQALKDYITKNQLHPTLAINTHGHIDHICGVEWVKNQYNIEWGANPAEEKVLRLAPASAQMYGFELNSAPTIDKPLKDGDTITLHNEEIKVLSTAGHSIGGLCFYIPSINVVITGDTLFKESIGRTDLPTGDYDQIMRSIKEVIVPLGSDVQVLPGHGSHTTIAQEMIRNPFITETL